MTDSTGRQWSVQEPVTFSVKQANTRFVYSLTKMSSFQNAYQKVTPVSSQAPNSVGVTYCPSTGSTPYTKNELAYDSTMYDSYRIGDGKLTYQIDVNIAQGTKSTKLSLTPSVQSASAVGISAKLSANIIRPDSIAYFSENRLVVQQSKKSPPMDPGFLIHQMYFYPARIANSIGITKDAWSQLFSCQQQQGFVVQIGSDPRNQLASFQSQTMTQRMAGCTADLSAFSYASTNGVASFKCSNMLTSIVFIEINTDLAGITLKKLFGEPVILQSGLASFQKTDTTAMLNIDIMNKADSSGSFTLRTTRCCVRYPGKDQFCDSFQVPDDITFTVSAVSTRRYQVPLPVSGILDKLGYCQLSVLRFGTVSTSVIANFDTTQMFSTRQVSSSSSCISPNVTYVYQGSTFCRGPCSTDDMEFTPETKVCSPVDCASKYQGQRNFFNSRTGYCESVRQCSSSQTYDPTTNTCSSSSSGGTSTGSGGTTYSSESIASAISAISTPTCIHGTLSADNTTCICDKGWTTGSTFSSILCSTMQINDDDGTSSSGNGNGTASLSGSSSTTNASIFTTIWLYITQLLAQLPTPVAIALGGAAFLVVGGIILVVIVIFILVLVKTNLIGCLSDLICRRKGRSRRSKKKSSRSKKGRKSDKRQQHKRSLAISDDISLFGDSDDDSDLDIDDPVKMMELVTMLKEIRMRNGSSSKKKRDGNTRVSASRQDSKRQSSRSRQTPSSDSTLREVIVENGDDAPTVTRAESLSGDHCDLGFS